jgi:hypothetical protein
MWSLIPSCFTLLTLLVQTILSEVAMCCPRIVATVAATVLIYLTRTGTVFVLQQPWADFSHGLRVSVRIRYRCFKALSFIIGF